MSLKMEKKRKGKLTRNDLRDIHSKRSPKAQAIDNSLQAPPAPTYEDWMKHPDEYDVRGVDDWYSKEERKQQKTKIKKISKRKEASYSVDTKSSIRPVIKWVGGKRQIEDIIYDLSPQEFEQYWEPFSGGAAIFFKLVREGKIDAAVLSDLNPQLSITYATLAEDVDSVIELLDSKEFENTEENYYRVREWDRRDDWQEWMKDRKNWPRVTARVIFLTKLSFNGLWRENSKGQHNAPYCKVPTKATFDKNNLLAVSRELQGINIGQASYSYLQKENWDILAQHYMPPCPTDFFFFDPPYVETFVGYTDEGFGWKDLQKLRTVTDDLSSIDAYTMITMKDSPQIRELFDGYRFVQMKTHCRINRDASKRKEGMNEIIIMNYNEDGDVIV